MDPPSLITTTPCQNQTSMHTREQLPVCPQRSALNIISFEGMGHVVLANQQRPDGRAELEGWHCVEALYLKLSEMSKTNLQSLIGISIR